MTKEELKKEAEDYARNTYEMCSYSGLPYASDRRAREQAFIAGAESREKRIAELEAQIEKMKCCGNCRWEEPSSFCDNCKRFEGQIFADTLISDNWEIKEK